MSLEEWNTAIRPKVDVSVNLHDALDTASLDFFIMLSSTVGLTGSVEQANYSAGGTFQDAFARSLAASQTASSGPVAVSLDLPVILDVGFVAEKPELMDQLRAAGWAYMEEEEFHAALGYHCFQRTIRPTYIRPQSTSRPTPLAGPRHSRRGHRAASVGARSALQPPAASVK